MPDFDELERLERAATEAPWYCHPALQDGRSEYDPGLEWLEISPYPESGGDGFIFSSSRDYIPSEDEANFDLIVALRNNAAELIRLARAAQAQQQQAVPELARDIRHKLAELIRDDCGEYSGLLDDQIDTMLREELAKAAPRWIPVSERLPKAPVNVWVADANKEEMWQGYCYSWPGDVKWYGAKRGCKPTHWMPLPAPPDA